MGTRFRLSDPGPCLTERQVAAVEKKLRISLPVAYRKFLLKYNGGRPEPMVYSHYKHERGFYTDFNVEWFLTIQEGHPNNFQDEFEFIKHTLQGLPHNLVPIAVDAFGNVIAISVSGRDRGAVYFRDSEGPEGKPGTGVQEWESIHLVADSFEEFLDGLRTEPDLSRNQIKKGRKRPRSTRKG